MKAYEACLKATRTRDAPWYAVPADDKPNTWLIISQIIPGHPPGIADGIPET
jgi:polyphosphate kinase 2 (PPK2 family)